MNLIINTELRKLLPPLSPDEKKILEENIVCDGCREPLVIWDNTIVDGHNRYEICKNKNIQFSTIELQANNIEDIKIWMIDNAKGRRNLTDGWKFELSQIRKQILLEQGRKTQGLRTDLLSTIDKKLDPHNTQKEIAEELGWSTGKVAMADKVWKNAKPEVKEKIKSGEITFNEVYKGIRKEQNIENRQKVKEKYDTDIKFKGEKKYRIIYADPPWMYNKGKELSDKYGDVQKHYPSMETEKICDYLKQIKLQTEKDCVLFLWVTAPKLPEGLKVMDTWGFQYKTCIIWDKIKHNFGFYFSIRHEILLIGGIGKSTPDIKELHDSVISIERSNKHSEKPAYFRDLIDKLYIKGNRIEGFAREKFEGWDNFGNEL